MSKFSKRERTLIFIMIVVAIVIGSVAFLIVPKYKDLGKLQGNLETLKLEKQTLMSDLYLLPTYENSVEQSQKQISDISSKLYSQMSNDDIDKLMSIMITSKGLNLTTLQIADIKEPTAETEPTTPNDENLESDEIVGEENEIQPVKKTVLKKSVYIELSGENENIIALADEITKNEKLVLLSFSTKPNLKNINATLIIQFNMVNK